MIYQWIQVKNVTFRPGPIKQWRNWRGKGTIPLAS